MPHIILSDVHYSYSACYPCSGVGLTFLFGFLLLVFSGVVFFFGANAQKVCQALEGPEYPLFSEVCSLHVNIYHQNVSFHIFVV